MSHPDILEIKLSKMHSKLVDFKNKIMRNEVNVAFLRNITIEPLIPYFEYQCFKNNVKTNIYSCEYDNIMQDILNPDSALYRNKPKIIFIFIDLEHIAPKLTKSFLALNSGEISSIIDNVVGYYTSMIDSLRANTEALIVLNTFIINPYPYSGILDSCKQEGQTKSIRNLNSKIIALGKNRHGVLFMDLDLINSRIGFDNFHDNMQWHMSKMPFSNLAMRHIAKEASKYVAASLGMTKKCIILDCDNTLWGGVLGEEGEDGILLDHSYPGSCFMEFQKILLNFKSKGILLAICSKNNESDVLSVLNKHENMVLSERDFSSMKINWDLKTKNIEEIAAELNIGLQHMVFVDDSEFEVEMVQEILPEVTTILVPKNISKLRYIFDGKGYFDNLQESELDSQRTEMYASENLRKKELVKATNLADYYKSLEIKSKITKIQQSDVARVTQLTQKTNQFNLTTIRYTENEIISFMDSDDSDVLVLRAEDRFGPYGLIGVAILNYKEKDLIIDSFLMSCRAIGRGLEEILLKGCIKLAERNNIEFIEAAYIKTIKNVLVEKFYENHGFKLKKQNENENIYISEIKNVKIIVPDYIRCQN